MFESLQEDINSFGLSDIMDIYTEYNKEEEGNKTSSTQTSSTAQKYDQIQQGVKSSNVVTSPLDSKLIVYGGLGLGALILIMNMRGK